MPKFLKKNKIKSVCVFCRKAKTLSQWRRGPTCVPCYNLGKRIKRPPTLPKLKLKRCYFCNKKREQTEWEKGPQCTICLEKYGPLEKKTDRLSFCYTKRKKSAKKRGHKWLLTPNEFYSLAKEDCFYCGISFTENKARLSLDRIDSLGDYTLGNVLPSCTQCNSAKNMLSVEAFAKWVNRIFSHSFWDKKTELERFKGYKCPSSPETNSDSPT